MSAPWYAVVTFGSPTSYTLAQLGPVRGPRVTQDLDAARERLASVRQHVSDARIVECPTRAAARDADISDSYRVVSS